VELNQQKGDDGEMIKCGKKMGIWVVCNVVLLFFTFWAWGKVILSDVLPIWFMYYFRFPNSRRHMNYVQVMAQYPDNLLGQVQNFWDHHFSYSANTVALLISIGAVVTYMFLFFIQVKIINVIEKRRSDKNGIRA
jgi:hypothetical protein